MPKRPRPDFRPNPKLAQFVYGGRAWPGYWEEALERVQRAESEDDLLPEGNWLFQIPRRARAVPTLVSLGVFSWVIVDDTVLRAASALAPWLPLMVVVALGVVVGMCVVWLLLDVDPPRRTFAPRRDTPVANAD